VIGPFVQLLTCSPSGDLVAKSLQMGLLAPFGVISTMIWNAPHPRELIQIGSYGNPDEIQRFLRRISVRTDIPIVEAYLSAQIVVTDLEEFSDNFHLVTDVPKLGPGGSVSCPIVHNGMSIGAFAIMRTRSHSMADLDVDLIQTIGYLLGLWLANTRADLDDDGVPSELGTAPLSLTDRQTQILHLIGEGCTSDEIAAQLAFSSSTVKQEVVRMKLALNVYSREDLVAEARRLSLNS